MEDNGFGILQACQANAYSMFTRFHSKVAFGGGLGMSLVRKHIDKLGAKIDFESSFCGARFTLVFA